MNLKANLSEDEILTIFLEGAIDSATAPEAETQIMDVYRYTDGPNVKPEFPEA